MEWQVAGTNQGRGGMRGDGRRLRASQEDDHRPVPSGQAHLTERTRGDFETMDGRPTMAVRCLALLAHRARPRQTADRLLPYGAPGVRTAVQRAGEPHPSSL